MDFADEKKAPAHEQSRAANVISLEEARRLRQAADRPAAADAISDSTPVPVAGSVQTASEFPAMPPDYAHPETAPEKASASSLPLWMQRVSAVILILFCIELGILLVILPWTDIWTNNTIVGQYPKLREFMALNFVRGAVSGLGLLDIWLGIQEGVNYKDA